MSLKDFAQNKKTYAVVVVGLVLGVIQGLNDSGVVNIHIPSYINWALGFVGLGALRMGVQAHAEQTTQQIWELGVNIFDSLRQQPQAVIVAQSVASTPAFKNASEVVQTDMLNASESKLKL